MKGARLRFVILGVNTLHTFSYPVGLLALLLCDSWQHFARFSSLVVPQRHRDEPD